MSTSSLRSRFSLLRAYRFCALILALVLITNSVLVPARAFSAAAPAPKTTHPAAVTESKPAEPPPSAPGDAPVCALYPIALHTQTLAGVAEGTVVNDIFNGSQPGNFGWLSWTGHPSVPTLVKSLTPPGDSETYTNPDAPDDHVVSVGDWVPGKPGVSNSKQVRDALDLLKTLDIIVPVWDATTNNGSNSRYHVAAFARIRLVSYQLPGQNRISARFLGYTTCDGTPPTPTPTPTPLPTETPTPTWTPESTPPPTITATPTSTPTATPTPIPQLPQLTLAVTAPATTSPGVPIPYLLEITNVGNAVAISATATISFPDGSTSSMLITNLAPGETINGTLQWTVPAIPTRGADETESAYNDRLAAADGTLLTSSVTLVWQDEQGMPLGQVSQSTTTTEQVPILTLAAAAPATVRPGELVTIDLTIQNVGSGASGPLRVRVVNPDGITTGATAPALPAGQTAVLHTSWAVPTFAKGSSESDADYQARLAANMQPQDFAAALEWEDVASNPYGTITAQASSALVAPLPILALELDGPEQVRAGEATTYTITLRNIGQSDAVSMSLALIMPDNTIRSLDPGAALAPGEQRQFSVPFVVGGAAAGSPYRAHAQATWQDSMHNAFGPISDVQNSTLVHDAPLAIDDAYDLNADQTLTVPAPGILANDLASDGQPLTAALAELPAHGTLALVETGAFRYTPDAGYTGTDSFRYRAGDGFTTSTTATVTLTIRPVNQPPQVDAGADQTITVPVTPPSGQINLVAISTDFNSPIGIDYYPPTNQVIISANYPSGQPGNFELIAADGSHTQFSTISGLTDELKLATARDDGNGMSRGGFPAGEIFTGSGVGGVIVRISADGTTIQNPWVALPGETGLMRGSLYVDRTGVYDGDLIVVTTAGNVWRVNAAGQPTRLAQLGTHLEGVTTVPNNPDKYGPWAGKILAGAEQQGRIYSIDPQGNTAFYTLGINPEDLDVIPANENFFGVDYAGHALRGAPASDFIGMTGDLLVTEESPGILWHVRWDGQAFQKREIARVAQWEHVTFAPAGIREIPPVSAQVQLQGTLADDGLPVGSQVSARWTKVSGPGAVVFADPTAAQTTASFSDYGTYVLRLSATDTELSASDEVVITIATVSILPDLQIDPVDNSAVVADGRTLKVTGTVSATVRNAGELDTPVGFLVTFFEDRNANGTFEPSADNVLGTVTRSSLAAGASASVSAPVAGTVLFRDNLIYAFVDSTNAIVEIDETNNVSNSSGECDPRPPASTFAPQLEWQWSGSTVLPSSNQVMMAPAVIDLDADGVPDIVFSTFSGGNYTTDGHLRAISGRDGRELFTVTDPAYDVRGAAGVAVGDIDLDGLPEILAGDESGSRIIAFEHDGSFKWRSPNIAGGVNWGSASIADLNQDGTPEIVIGATVLNNNGTLRWSGAFERGDNSAGPLSLVANLDMAGDPEVVAGNTAYRSDGSVYWRNTSLSDGFNAVANFDTDAFPEVVLVDAGRVYLLNHDGSLKWGPASIPGGGSSGAPTVADVDNDGQPEIGVAGASRYAVFETDGTLKWSRATQDASSNVTGSAVFDFEGDGAAEVIYGDEVRLRIYRGSDGTVLWETPSTSGTTYELPIIVDVDGDGNAEIVKISNNYYISGPTGIQVYGDSNDTWVATRQIWNQHSYHITNVNDDGAIPLQEANSWELYNSYRQNVLTGGCATADPDLTASYVRKATADGSITLTVRIGNGGGNFVPAGVSVTWYNGDPTNGGQPITTVQTTRELAPGQYEDVVVVLPAGSVAEPLWVVADDTGNGQGIHREINELNNRHSAGIYLTNPPNQGPAVAAGPDQEITLPVDTVTLAGTATDDGLPVGQLDIAWSLVSGPGNVTFADAQAAQTEATFSAAGTYVLRLSATDQDAYAEDELTIVIHAGSQTPTPSGPLAVPGWIGGPANQSVVSTPVQITLAPGVTLQQGTIDYWPADDPGALTPLATNVAGGPGATLATFDPTLLANGSYIIRLSGTDSGGNQVNSGILVTVVGEYKPGRVRFSMTDLIVPVTGLPITIGRTYDSLERNRSGDFGYGWSLSVGHPQLTVDQANNVTLTQPGGKRVTFFFAPVSYGGIFGFLLKPGYTPEPGVYGSLSANGCPLMVSSGGSLLCFLSTAQYQPTVYTYTDPYGRVYTMGADGSMISIRDLNGNTLMFGPDGIASSAGDLIVPFVRDSQGRITQITDPAGNIYRYSYDAAGDLVEVALPDVEAPLRYTYDADHLILSTGDPRGHIAAQAIYYPNGRIARSVDAVGNEIGYTYDVTTGTTAETYPDGGVVTLRYDSHGMLLSRTDPLSRTISYTYDGNHNRISQTNPLGHTTHYTYNSNGHLTSVTNPLGHTTHATYNQYGEPTSQTNPLGTVWTIQYNANFLPSGISDNLGDLAQFTWNDRGALLTQSDGNGKTTGFTYDAYGNMLVETDALNNTTTSIYNLLGQRLTSTDARGHSTSYQYTGLGNVTFVTNALGEVTGYEYDSNGNIVAKVDPTGRRTTAVYDAANRLTDATYPDGTSSGFSYDFRGKLLTQSDQSGRTERYRYNQAGELIEIVSADGTPDQQHTTYEYDAAGRKVTETDALGHTTTYAYDAADRLVSMTDPLGRVTEYTYDNAGRVTSSTDGNGNQTHYAYDIRGRQVLITYPDNTTVTQNYDGNNNLLSRIDQAGKTTSYQYDDENRLLAVANPLGETTRYAYDPIGNLITITDANDHEITFVYDDLDRLTRKIWPDNSFEAQTYDLAGNVINHRLADGNVNSFSYNAVNQLVRTTYFDGQTVDYTYTPTGRRQTVIDGRGTTHYQYDGQDRLIDVTHPDGQSISYTYDELGNRSSLTTAAGTINYHYDAASQLIEVVSPQGATTQYGYDDAGNRSQMQFPNGIRADYRYDQLNRLTELAYSQGSQNLASYTYTLGAAGNRLGVVEVGGAGGTQSIQWEYDDAYRLTGETLLDDGGTIISRAGYTYDAVGNRLTKMAGAQTTTYTYNELDQLITLAQGSQSAEYTYDDRGNLTRADSGSNTTSYTYDAADRLVQVTLPDSTNIGYQYDAVGRRVQQVHGSRITNYLWDEETSFGDVVLETDGNGAIEASYVLGNDGLISQNRSGITSYYLQDGQGSVRSLADAGGAITDRYDYDAYGEQRFQQGATVNPYRYTGQQFDESTGLYSLRARYYNPSEGRFLTRDTAAPVLEDPVELNRYGYARNNPVNFIDPTGLMAELAMHHSSVTAPSIPAFGQIGTANLVFLYSVGRALALYGVLLIAISVAANKVCNPIACVQWIIFGIVNGTIFLRFVNPWIDWAIYQFRVAGPIEFDIRAAGVRSIADGLSPATCSILDAKFVRNPLTSTFVTGAFSATTLNQLARYRTLIMAPGIPFTNLVYITNHPIAALNFLVLLYATATPGFALWVP